MSRCPSKEEARRKRSPPWCTPGPPPNMAKEGRASSIFVPFRPHRVYRLQKCVEWGTASKQHHFSECCVLGPVGEDESRPLSRCDTTYSVRPRIAAPGHLHGTAARRLSRECPQASHVQPYRAAPFTQNMAVRCWRCRFITPPFRSSGCAQGGVHECLS